MQRARVIQRQHSRQFAVPLTIAVEWPTLFLLFAVYTGIIVLTSCHESVAISIILPLLAILVAQHSSLQHEVLHGHPFRDQRLSDLTVFVAIGLLVPFERFRHLHLKHHADPNLTDPYDDPESNYEDPEVWMLKSAAERTLLRINNTLLGRMIVGPAISLWWCYRGDIREMVAGRRIVWRGWALHLLGVLPVLAWLAWVAFPIWAYLVAAYCGLSLLKIRTFLEHRAHERSAARSVIIEDRGPLALLFLNNNFHAVHHRYPKVAWYHLPALYSSRREEFLRRNDGYCYRSYREVIARHLFWAKDPVAHPFLQGEHRAGSDPSKIPTDTSYERRGRRQLAPDSVPAHSRSSDELPKPASMR
ncbi:MAG: fatty acid desaturase [Pseudomonadota bacterium]